MAKRKTRAQREAEQRDALHQRIADIFAGACGRVMDVDYESASLEEIVNIVNAIRETFGEPIKDWCGWGLRTLPRFETVEAAVEHLFENGFRAGQVWRVEDPS